MTRAKGEDAKKKLDRLAELLRDAPPGELQEFLAKTESITVRLTAAEKDEMKAAATWYGLTLTDYLTRLHGFAEERRRLRLKRK